jgi:nicotinamidase-related amidase
VWRGVDRPEHYADVIAELVARARARDVWVVWVQQTDDDHLVAGTEDWELIPSLRPLDGEPVVQKRFGDAFAGTDLAAWLRARGVRRVLLCGAETDACVRSSFYGGLYSGFDMVLVSDAHTTGDLREWGLPFGPEQSIAVLNQHAAESVLPDVVGGVVTSGAAFDGQPGRTVVA